MASNNDSIWVYNPSFPLAVVGCVIYSLLFVATTYTTWVKHRAWFFSAVVVGAAVEVAGYACRVYSAKNQAVLVSQPSKRKPPHRQHGDSTATP